MILHGFRNQVKELYSIILSAELTVASFQIK